MDRKNNPEGLTKANGELIVTPVTEYDPFEAKFCASLYWLVFQATEDGTFDDVPSQITSPIIRDSDRITIRPEVVEFLTLGEIYGRVCNCVYPRKVSAVGHWAVIQMLSRHGVYVVEDGDIAVTDSALQQRKPFRKSTHLSLMDALMTALAAQLVDTQRVVKCVRRISSFNASRELPFDLEDSLLLWVNKVCAALNTEQLKKQKLQAEQLLLNQDKSKRFRFRRDQLQPKVQSTFPCLDDLLKDISDGQCLLGVILFYRPKALEIQDICFGKDLSTEQIVQNLERFRIKCSQFICTSALSLKIEDIMYGSQAMKPNIIALLAEMFHKCEEDDPETSKNKIPQSEVNNTQENQNGTTQTLNSCSDLVNGIEQNDSSSLNNSSGCVKSTSAPEQLCGKEKSYQEISKHVTPQRAVSENMLNKAENKKSYQSPFQLDFTDDLDLQYDEEILTSRTANNKDKQNPFSGIFQRPVLAGSALSVGGGGSPRVPSGHSSPRVPSQESTRVFDNNSSAGEDGESLGSARLHVGIGGVDGSTRVSASGSSSTGNRGSSDSPRLPSKQDQPLLLRRMKQKQRSLVSDSLEGQQEGVEELQLHDLQRSQSLNSGLDNARLGPRLSFHAWQDTSASLSESNLNSATSNRISLQFRTNQSDSHNSTSHKEEVVAASPRAGQKSTPLDQRQRDSVASGAADSLTEFEQIEAMVRAEKEKEASKVAGDGESSPLPLAEEDDLNVSCTSDDMNRFRMEVLRRVTEDKGEQEELQSATEMEDDDDPIFLARQQAAVSSQLAGHNGVRDVPSSTEPQTSLACPENSEQMELLSPITETSEPNPSTSSNYTESIPSQSSTAPSSPCSPLDIAPFNPMFLTTSPVNTEETVQEVDRRRQSSPLLSYTPRLQPSSKRGNTATFHSTSFESLVRGSYTVDQVSLEAAKAAGIPVIGITEVDDSCADKGDENDCRASVEEGSLVDALNSLKNVINEEPNELSPTTPKTLNGHGSDFSHGWPVSSSLNTTENMNPTGHSYQASGDPSTDSPGYSQHGHVISSQPSDTQSKPGEIQSPGDDVIIYDRQSSIGENGCKDDGKIGRAEHFSTFVKKKKAEAFVFDFDESALNQYQQLRNKQQETCDSLNGSHSLRKDVNSLLDTPGMGGDETDTVKPKGSTIGRFSTFRKEARPTVVQVHHGKEMQDTAPSDSGSASVEVLAQGTTPDDRFRTFRKLKRQLEQQNTSSPGGGEVVQQLYRGGSEPSTVDTHRSSDSNVDTHRSSVSNVDTHRSSDPNVETPQQFSPGTVTRSRTFRKSSGSSDIAGAKPQDFVSQYGGIERGAWGPSSFSASPRSMSPQSQQQAVRQENRHSENKNVGSARISWSETGDNLAMSPRQLQPAANKQAHVGTPPRTRSPRQDQGRSSPSARISWVTAAKCGVGGQVFLNDKGEIEEGAGEGENQTASSQLALLHMQLEEKRRHIEAEKLRNQSQLEEERRRLGQTAFWYVLGKARGEPGHEEHRPQPEGDGGHRAVPISDKIEQPFPPIGYSSPTTSPRGRQQMERNTTVPEYETREFRLSEFPPQGHILEGHYKGAFPAGAEVPGNIRPKRERTPPPPVPQVPLIESGTPPRKCWTLNPAMPSTPPPFTPPSTGEVNRGKQDAAFGPTDNGIGIAEVEVDEVSPKRGGMALFIGEDANTGSQGLTPEQQKKRDRFLQSRLKKQEEERARKEAELEKKRRREEKHREKEMQKKQEEERRRWEEKERQKIERERLDRAQAERERLTQESELAAGYATYRARPGVRSRVIPDRVALEPVPQYQPHVEEDSDFAAYGRPQSGFAEFSGPQCYVKPSGKSNRKIMVNAVSHVCLCGVPNKEAKEKCLQAINESPVQNFIALFRDGLKFRGLYSYIPDADQITKIYGIGPRVVTVKMIENVFKYNSGGKEFVKIPSTKTLSIQVDGITIQKGFWQTSKPAVQSKTMSNLRRPPPRTHR